MDGFSERHSTLLWLSGAGAVSAYCLYKWLFGSGGGTRPGPPVDFESYLKVRTENPSLIAARRAAEREPAPTDFEAYLKVRDPKSVTHKFSSNETSDDELAPPAHLKPVGVLYGTEFGLSREVCESLCDSLSKTEKYWPMMMSMDDYPKGFDLQKFQALFVACSTQGEGVPPTDARPFCAWLQSQAAPVLSNLKFSVCALGDTSYTHFAQCGKDVDRRLENLGGVRIAQRIDVNKEDWSAINRWIASVVSALDKQQLNTIEELDGDFKPASKDVEQMETFSKSRPYMAEVVNVSSLCSITGGDDKNTIRVDIDLGDSGLTYLPGDSLGIWPQNDERAVDELVSIMGWDADALMARPSWHYKDSRIDGENGKMTLKDLLMNCYDLKCPKPDILDVLAGEMAAVPDALKGMMADSSARSLYLEERHVVDILMDFGANKQKGWVGPDTIVKFLRQLVPRLYSISSSPLDKPGNVTLTVAVVEYEQLGKERIGVCSTYLNNRVSKGSKVPIYIYENPDFRLPEADTTPIIMVGPGTGVAPFRSFLQDRIIRNPSVTSKEHNILFFGSRRKDQDFLYGEELEGWQQAEHLSLYTAFSRETSQKVYVQHRLKEHSACVWDALENGGHFYICGDGQHMSTAVEAALESIIEEHQGQGADEAKLYVQNLLKDSRIQKDVWIS